LLLRTSTTTFTLFKW